MTIDNLLMTDDHIFYIDGVVAELRKYYSINNVAACTSPQQALKCASEKKYDLYILDLGFRTDTNVDIRCLSYVQQIGKIDCNAKILIYTMREDFAMVSILFDMKNVSGIVLKNEKKEPLLEGVETILRGNRYLSPRFITMHERSEKYRERLKKRKLTNGLPTEKEVTIIKMIAAGLKTEGIAKALGHTPSTIDSYRKDIKFKFNVSNLIDLIVLALLLNYISLDDVALNLLEE